MNSLKTVRKKVPLLGLHLFKKGNLFDTGGWSINTNSYSLPPLETYLPRGLSNDTYRRLAIGSMDQMQKAFHNYSQSVINNFGKGPLVQGTSMLNTTDPNTFFNLATDTAGTLGSAAREKGTSLFSKDAWQSGGAGWGVAGAAAGALGKIDTGERRGMWDTLDPVHHLAGGRESAVGNAMGDTGVALTQAGLSSGQPWLALAGAGLKVVGGLTNAAFGIKEDKALVNNAENSINQNQNYVFGDSLDNLPEIASGTNTDAYKGGWFSGSKARKKNAALLERMITAKDWALRSLENGVNNLLSDLINDALANYSAFGGFMDVDPSTAIGYSIYTDRFIKDKNKNKEMANMFAGTPDIFGFGGGIYTKGANFDTGVSYINAGGTHEENPNEGVQMGVDSQGVPNLVEEGEVKWGDYMFSDRLVVPRGKRGNYGKRARKYAEGGKLIKGKGIDTPYESLVLKPYEGLTFAEAAKRIVKRNGADERDDAITMRGVDAQLSVLAGILEKEREKEKLREMQETIDNMSPEEFAMLQQQMEAQQAALQQQEMAMQQLQMIPEGMELMQPVEEQQPIAALGGLLDSWKVNNTYATGGDIDNSNTVNTSQEVNMFEDGGFRDWWKKYITTPVTENRVSGPDYGALYKAFTGKDDLKDSEEVYNALQQLYGTNPEKFTAYDLVNNTFTDSENTESVIEETITPEEAAASSNEEIVSKEEVKGPEVAAFNYYNSRHSDKPLTAEQWNALGEKEKGRYIKQYKGTLGKDDKIAFDESLTAYNKQQELNDKVAKYQKQQRESTLIADDIKDLGYEDKVRLAKYMNPDYQAQDLSKLSLNERDEAKKALDELLVLMSKDKDITLDNLSKNFAAPQYHRDWKPVDAEKAWVNNGYNWDNPIYGEPSPVPVELGNTEGHWQPRDWTILDEGEYKGKIKVGDNYYDSMKDYELSDAYLNPRYALAASAAAKDEEGRKLWNDYVSGRLDPKYAGSYDPKLVFGDDFANNVGSEEEFKNYIRSNYDTLHTKDKNGHRSGFFDLIAGQMHGTYNPIRNRELYQMSDNIGNYLAPEGNWLDYYTDSVTDDNKGTILHTLTPRGGIAFTRVNGTPEDIEVKPDGTYVAKGTGESDPFPKAASWPYAIAAGLLLGSLGYNILRPADYSNADAMIKASLSAGTYNPIEFRPIGNYLTYRPDDPWFYTSPIMAQSNSTLRALANKVSPSKGAETLANSYATMLALGQAQRLQLDNNFNKYAKVGEFNKDTDKFNSEGFLKADMANQDAASRARMMTLEGLKAGYAMRLAIDDAKANAINVGLSGLANLAYNYAGNKYNQDLLGWGMRHNAWGPGISYKGSKGGKIRRKRGIGF